MAVARRALVLFAFFFLILGFWLDQNLICFGTGFACLLGALAVEIVGSRNRPFDVAGATRREEAIGLLALRSGRVVLTAETRDKRPFSIELPPADYEVRLAVLVDGDQKVIEQITLTSSVSSDRPLADTRVSDSGFLIVVDAVHSASLREAAEQAVDRIMRNILVGPLCEFLDRDGKHVGLVFATATGDDVLDLEVRAERGSTRLVIRDREFLAD